LTPDYNAKRGKEEKETSRRQSSGSPKGNNVNSRGWDPRRRKAELEALFGRPVDLVEKEALRNPWRKREVLRTYEVVYAA
jgi:hypothetical protein